MPLVFVHGVANRPTSEQVAEIVQRDGLFRAITFGGDSVQIFNPDWGSNAVSFDMGLRWLPNPNKTQPFAMGDAVVAEGVARDVGLGRIAKVDGPQAVDLTVSAALEEAVVAAGKNGQPAAAAHKELMVFAQTAAKYLTQGLPSATAEPKGIAALAVQTDQEFADALDAEFRLLTQWGHTGLRYR
jgi:hypothetical protein